MSWYSSPIQPLDPVVVSQTPKPPIRYMRDNFSATGQNSYVKPPAQDQSMWQALTNVMPITQGILNQRWGYGIFIADLPIIGITYLNPAGSATVGVSSTVGLTPGQTITIIGNSNSHFNGTFVIASIINGTAFSIFFSFASNQSGTGGVIFSFPASNRLYDFQSDALGTRTIIAAGLGGITGFNENGTIYNANIFSPVATSGIIRSTTSRNYQYFCDGNNALNTTTHLTGDSLKWNGASSGGVTNIGINVADVTQNSVTGEGNTQDVVVGPDTGTSAVDISYAPDPNPWTNPPGVFSNSVATGAYTNIQQTFGIVNGLFDLMSQQLTTDTINATDFFSFFPSPTVLGIQVAITYTATAFNASTRNTGGVFVQLLKAGSPVGNQLGFFLNIDGNTHTQHIGSATNLWDASFVPSDITNAGFGAAIYGNGNTVATQTANGVYTSGYTINISYITITVFGGLNPGISTSSGAGVGIISENSGGGVSLVIGRTYYLVANNSLTGHFSDLSPASVTTGPCQDSYFDLLLATFNDPQVDTKYLLATADGGDPSILYEVPVIVGTYFVISSWAIVSDVLTLTGTYENAASTTTISTIVFTRHGSLGSTVVTVASTAGLNAGQTIEISGNSNPLFNGTFTISYIISPTQFLISFFNTMNQSGTGGTVGPGPYAPGTIITVQGLVHGNYIDGNALTVTGGTGTTITTAFISGNDAATEAGIAGPTTFAIPNNVTTVIDATPDPTLVLDQPLLYTDTSGNEFGVVLNDPPPAGNIILKHQGRLWMAGVSGATHSVFFSKSVTELTLPDGFIAGKYEEAWPGSNYFDVSDGAESVSGLLTDGTTLYIGTQNHIRRLIGSSPSNFQEPQIVHPEVGLINQEVWQTVFMQGAPSGCIWMTPDFKVIQSDFNTYVDIGTPIQDILNAQQPTAPLLAHAAYVADGEYDLYILAIPYKQSTYCDTHLVFDLRARQWFVWQPAGGSLSLMYNVTQAALSQWLFIGGAGTAINIYGSTDTTDNGTVIPVTATTTWMHLGEPTRRKMLNEVQVYGNTTMTMNVYGANNLADFLTSPRPIVYNRTLKQSPFGTWNLYLTGAKTRHRYYQFTFNSSNGQIPLLGSYSISAIPLDDL
jgi:hypothetical protein